MFFKSDEIRQITFNKAARGYRTEDVESFIDNVADDYAELESEKKDLEDKLYVLAERVEQYKAEEESIKTTLINAQRLGESIVEDAKEKADNIIREATIKKNDILSSSYAEVESNEEALKKLKKEVSDFKRNVLGLYKAHIETLSNIPEEKPEAQPKAGQSRERSSKGQDVSRQSSDATAEFTPSYRTRDDDNTGKFKSVSSLFNEE